MDRLRISIVDDDLDFADGLADLLELWGHEVVVSRDGEQAIQSHRESSFDVTFMDVRLPGMNGVESLRAIRQIRSDARIIIMTGYTVPSLLNQARDEGAWQILAKPLDMNAVIRLLGELSPRRVVLVADDDVEFQASVAEVLISSGFEVVTATDGAEAIAIVESDDIHALILDLRLPDKAGVDVYRELEGRGLSVPTIFVTAYSQEEVRAMRALGGDTGILRKPFPPEHLVDQIQDLTREAHGE